MNKKIRVLLAGESWVSTSVHYKGFNHFASAFYETGEIFLRKALSSYEDIDFMHMPSHLIPTNFPLSEEDIKNYDVLILSDIGSDSFLLHPDVFLKGEIKPNRLKLIKDWVSKGGGLIMCGGYLSFSGFGAAAKYYRTPIEDILPVNIYTYDDRVETPEGSVPKIINNKHPILNGIDPIWPALLGYQELKLKESAILIAELNNNPLLSVQDYFSGRSVAWSTDIGPHWCPSTFLNWKFYGRLWHQIIQWSAHRL